MCSATASLPSNGPSAGGGGPRQAAAHPAGAGGAAGALQCTVPAGGCWVVRFASCSRVQLGWCCCGDRITFQQVVAAAEVVVCMQGSGVRLCGRAQELPAFCRQASSAWLDPCVPSSAPAAAPGKAGGQAGRQRTGAAACTLVSVDSTGAAVHGQSQASGCAARCTAASCLPRSALPLLTQPPPLSFRPSLQPGGDGG